MAGGASKSDDEEISGINVTPFVDIALVLLIIFMVTAKYIVSQSIPVDLPSASTGAAASSPSPTVSISIDRAQHYFIDSTAATDAQVLTELRSRFEQNNEVRAVINADRTVPHGRVVQLIDLVREAGITHFAIQTEQPASP